MPTVAHRTPTDPMRLEPPLDDPVYRAVVGLRQPGALAERVRATWSQGAGPAPRLLEVAVLQTHYKPRSRARILAEAVIDADSPARSPASQFLYIQVYATSDEARRRFVGAGIKRPLDCFGPPLFRIDDLNAVVWSLPNGPRLRRVAKSYSPEGIAAFLAKRGLVPAGSTVLPSQLRLVRYVPRKRALFLHRPMPGDGPTLYIKHYARSQFKKAAANLKALAKAAAKGRLDFRCPRMVARGCKRRVVVLDEVPGIRLTDLADPTPELFAALGHALASLHNSGLRRKRSWTPDGELRALGGAMSDIVMALPALAPALKTLVDRITGDRARIEFTARCPIHGNLFGDQILVESGRIGIVDWDDLCLGDPYYDVGRLIAHLIFVARQQGVEPARRAHLIAAMVDAYGRDTGRQVDWVRLRWQIAVALVLRAKISALRPLSTAWIDELDQSTIEASRILDGHSAWLPAD